ncbi:peroxisomal carnitine O-octanoyltransferase-like isoform X2 [Ornithodoros turicata]|uniref:peroxisomal carnitine O-octanoyltransferase-like isoform X2 n=1 Tax=Ornithodoros turicata TaxID=34597 RepID=UPI0031399E79
MGQICVRVGPAEVLVVDGPKAETSEDELSTRRKLRETAMSMSARKERERLYITDGERTFSYDENLPSLPVPCLKQTMEKYLSSVKALVSEEELFVTKSLAEEFEQGIGAELHEKLLQRAKDSPNWLEKWWEDMAYLSSRNSLLPLSHMSGSFAVFEDAFTYPGKRSSWAAKNVWYYLSFWKLLRLEQLKPQSFRKIPWSMNQFRRLFNTVRIPQEGKDEIVNKFLPEGEETFPGESPTNVIVLCSGHIFSFGAVNENGEPITVDELSQQLEYIELYCAGMEAGPGIGALTVGDRDSWAENRDALRNLHPENERNLQMIEDALLVVVLDNAAPENRTEVMTQCLMGDCSNRWADKSYTMIVYKNLTIGSAADHTPFDGMVPVSVGHYAHLCHLEGLADNAEGTPSHPQPLPKNLKFHLNEHLYSEINYARQHYQKLCDNIDLFCEVFEGYGKSFMKPIRIHPEAYLQIALQLAYYKLHNRPAPTYTTASTRQFYHGRTETCRSCTPELVAFVEAMLDNATPTITVLNLLKQTVETFTYLMMDCCSNSGCDRHLMGLAMVALEEGIPMPELFFDPSFVKSGGNGNFILSTSCTGYTPLVGCVAPMCKDGYGVFYSIEDERIIVAISAFRESAETDARHLYQNVVQALFDLQQLLLSAKL